MSSVIGDGNPPAAPGERQAVGMSETRIAQFEHRPQIEAHGRSAKQPIERYGVLLEIAGGKVVVGGRDERHAIGILKPRLGTADFELGSAAECSVTLAAVDRDGATALRYRHELAVRRRCEGDIVRIVKPRLCAAKARVR